MPDGREHTAPFFGVALARFSPDLQMRVLVTPEAREMHYESFAEQVIDYVAELEAVDIPGGANEEELWCIFETVIDLVDDRESVIFDITHGFRSLPFLSFLAVAYLKVIKDIQLVSVLYGNFEARDRSVTPNRAPVIDLTPFISLLNWTIAADRFTRFGDARDLARLLDDACPPNHLLATQPELRPLNSSLRSASGALRSVSQALHLIRPYEAIAASEQLQSRLLNATQSFQQNARPFLPLSRRVADTYKALALDGSRLEADLNSVLERERTMVQWYLDRSQYVQAVAVAREWLVSWAMVQIGETDLLDRGKRMAVEQVITALIHSQRTEDEPIDDPVHSQHETDLHTRLAAVDGLERLVAEYDHLGQIRNDLLHAGKNKSAMRADRLERQVLKIGQILDGFRLPEPA